tara:strand:+ start:23285 stop:24559 length:1275 start_codon:yes stop_codon:yes gene_type:complete
MLGRTDHHIDVKVRNELDVDIHNVCIKFWSSEKTTVLCKNIGTIKAKSTSGAHKRNYRTGVGSELFDYWFILFHTDDGVFSVTKDNWSCVIDHSVDNTKTAYFSVNSDSMEAYVYLPDEDKHKDHAGHSYTCHNDIAVGWIELDSTLSFGSYTLSPGIHHTYVTGYFNDAPDVEYKFPCWGGTNGDGKAFDDKSHKASLRQAIRVCCTAPVNKKLPSGRTFGDHTHPTDQECGLTYALSGVCHQMANRVMSFRSTITPAQIPDTIGSYLLYGTWGFGPKFTENFFHLYLNSLGYQYLSKPSCVDINEAVFCKPEQQKEHGLEYAVWREYDIYPEDITAEQHIFAREIFAPIHDRIKEIFELAKTESLSAENVYAEIEEKVKKAAKECAEKYGNEHELWATLPDVATSGIELEALRSSLNAQKVI